MISFAFHLDGICILVYQKIRNKIIILLCYHLPIVIWVHNIVYQNKTWSLSILSEILVYNKQQTKYLFENYKYCADIYLCRVLWVKKIALFNKSEGVTILTYNGWKMSATTFFLDETPIGLMNFKENILQLKCYKDP